MVQLWPLMSFPSISGPVLLNYCGQNLNIPYGENNGRGKKKRFDTVGLEFSILVLILIPLTI